MAQSTEVVVSHQIIYIREKKILLEEYYNHSLQVGDGTMHVRER